MGQFYQLFTYCTDKETVNLIGSSEIVDANVDKEERIFNMVLRCNQIVDYSVVKKAEQQISEVAELNKTNIRITYSKHLFDLDEIEKIVSPLKYTNSAANGFFEGVEAETEDSTLTLCLKKGGKDILEAQKVDKEISQLIYDQFGLDFDVTLMEVKAYDIKEAVNKAVEEKRRQEEEQKKKEENDFSRELWGNTPLYTETKKTVMGRPIRELPKPIKDVMPDDGYITVWGDIVKTDVKDTKRGDSKILTFDISD